MLNDVIDYIIYTSPKDMVPLGIDPFMVTLPFVMTLP